MAQNLLIKVCGMRQPDNIRDVAQLPINYMGFIFYPKSSRYVDTPVGYDDNAKHINKVGVFVDASAQNIITHIVDFRLDAIQLHSSETPTAIHNLKATVIPDICPQLKIFKAISITSADDFDKCSQYEGLVDMFVFDTKCEGHGGSGQQFDWSVLHHYKGNTPFLLSGGIGSDDAARICAIQHPQLAGVDLNSRFESAPAVKDTKRLAHFINQLTEHQHIV